MLFRSLKSTGEAGLSVNQLIFYGSYLVGLQAVHALKELSYKNTAMTREQIIQNVTKAYYGVLINKERIGLFNTNIGRVDSLFRNTRALHQNGFAESIDVDRIQVTLNNLRVERDKFANLNELGLQLLKFQMNYPMDEPIEVLGNIEDVEVVSDLNQYKENWDYKQRPDFQVLETNYKLQSLNVKNQYATAMPKLSAFANVGYSTQSPDVKRSEERRVGKECRL